jgi:hypothetical protein
MLLSLSPTEENPNNPHPQDIMRRDGTRGGSYFHANLPFTWYNFVFMNDDLATES